MSNLVGRPTVITEDIVRKLEQSFRDGLNISQACYVSGIGSSTYYDHISDNQDFSDKMKLAQEYVTIKSKRVISEAINKGDVASSKWWLEHKARDEFGQRNKEETAGEPYTIQVKFVGDSPDEYNSKLQTNNIS